MSWRKGRGGRKREGGREGGREREEREGEREGGREGEKERKKKMRIIRFTYYINTCTSSSLSSNICIHSSGTTSSKPSMNDLV